MICNSVLCAKLQGVTIISISTFCVSKQKISNLSAAVFCVPNHKALQLQLSALTHLFFKTKCFQVIRSSELGISDHKLSWISQEEKYVFQKFQVVQMFPRLQNPLRTQLNVRKIINLKLIFVNIFILIFIKILFACFKKEEISRIIKIKA